ncbi:hypothetical protein ACFLXY_10250 [Chloroflexota bacterium]
MVEIVESDRKQLEPRVLRGHPVQLIFGEAQRRNLIVPLQYTYYKYLIDNPRNELVDTAVIVALLITMDLWEDTIKEWEHFEKYIINPLMTGSNIPSVSHDMENFVQNMYPDKRESPILVKDRLGYGPQIMMPSQKKTIWSEFERHFSLLGSKRRGS